MSTAPFQGNAGSDAQARATAIAVATAVAVILLTLLMLRTLARPSGLNLRLSDLNARIARVETLRSRSTGPAKFGPGAICSLQPGPEAAALRTDLQTAQAKLHLPLFQLSVLGDDSAGGGPVEATRFSLDANADYAQAIKLMNQLGQHRPSVILDRVDLHSNASFIRLHLDGRVYCWAHAAS